MGRSFRSRSRSTPPATARRCTSTARSFGRFVAEQAPTLRRLPDTRNAIDDLRREPAAAIFANAHSGLGTSGDDALFHSILLPTLAAVAERSGGFDWSDEAFEGAYAGIERSLFGSARSYAAIAPLVGLSAGQPAELGGGIQVRAVVPGELSSLWPEALGLMPPEFGRDVDRLCVLELTRELDASDGEPPDAAGELADAVSALRLATAGAIAAGPVVFERLDFRPLRISPLLPIAATKPLGDAIRLDSIRAGVAADLRERLPLADEDRELGEALDRWELSLFADEPFRSGQVKDALTALLGAGDGSWAATMRAAVLLQEETKERATSPPRSAAKAPARWRAMRCAARLSRRSCTATGSSSSRRSTRRCSACVPRPATGARRLAISPTASSASSA